MPNRVSVPSTAADQAAAVGADISIPMPCGEPLRARVYGRKRPRVASALVLHFHGGAFVSGDLDSGACMARLLAEVGVVVVSVAYPLAPGHRFPVAVEAGYAALEWVYKQRAKLAGTGAPVYVAGEESGGNLAAAVVMVARDRGHPPLAGQILVAPMLDPCVGTASLRESMECNTGCKWIDGWQQYLRGPMDAEHPYAVPARALRLVDLPPALVLTGQDDPMRDEALVYVQRLRDAGIAVTAGVLGRRTGWPDSLSQAQGQCECAAGVQQHLREFFFPATPPPL